MSLRNRSNQEATVALSVDVDLLSGHFVNREVATVRVGATQTLRVVLPAERLQGFDVASQEWSRTTLREANGQLAAVFLANNTMERAVSIGATIGVNALRISPASSVAAFYCHTGTDTGCTTQRTLRVHLSTTHGKSSSTQAPVTSSRGRTTELRLLLSCVLSLSRRADFARFRYTHDGPH